MRSILVVTAIAIASAVVAVPCVARAEGDTEVALSSFERGRKLARDGRCEEAIPVFLESVRRVEGVGALLNLGACYETLGKTASAQRTFRRAERVAAARDDPRREEAATRARALDKVVSTLTVRIPGTLHSDVLAVRVDDESWPEERWNVAVPVDPGAHVIEASGPGYPRRAETIVVRGSAEQAAWDLPASFSSFAPRAAMTTTATAATATTATTAADGARAGASEAPSSGQRTLGFAVGGIGVASAIAGGVVGVMALDAHRSLVDRCPSYPTCDVSDRADLDGLNSRARTLGDISTITLVAGGVMLVTSAVLLLTAPHR